MLCFLEFLVYLARHLFTTVDRALLLIDRVQKFPIFANISDAGLRKNDIQVTRLSRLAALLNLLDYILVI